MHLKSLEIQGFKSFPERTLIEFHPGVTAIIGPNGSGKSNVTDAIRWVLGEQSVKTLRGSRMEDIIFTGTQSRKAMSFAEVSMTIDNQDQKLPFDYTEIQITRRLYRSGESEYLLNKTHCRLKDIVSLFMDTGLGRDGYSIVGQGKVDDILSHRSEDRRKIFEEASGIVKYKTRKEDAEKKLFNTDQNLLRINDIIQELSEQMEPLSDQADSARKYLGLKTDLKEIELAYMLDQADQLSIKQQDCIHEKSLLEEDLLKQQNVLDSMREENRMSLESMKDLDDQIEQKRQALNELSLKVNDLAGETALGNERISQLNLRTEQGEQLISEAVNALDLLASDISGRQKKLDTLNKQKQIYQNRLQQAEADMQSLQSTLSKQENELENWKVTLDNKLEAIYEKKSELGQIKGQLELIGQRKRSLELETGDLGSDRNRMQFQIEDAEDKMAQLQSDWQKAISEHNELKSNLEKQRQQCKLLSEQIEEQKQNQRNAQYKLKTLENMEKSHEGYQESVRNLMKQAETDPALVQGVKGTLGELIHVEEKFELAAETALGAAVQNIVTDNDQTASRLIGWLKNTRSGRATFLPVNQIKGRRLDNSVERQLSGMSGFLGVACDLVQKPDYLEQIVLSLLGRVIIVDNIDNARSMARACNFSTRLVTLEGDVMNPGGSMTGGYQRRGSSGLLGRSRDIQRLHNVIKDLNNNIEKQEDVLKKADDELRSFGRLSEESDLKITNMSHQRIKDESHLAALKDEYAKIEGRFTLLSQEAGQLAEQADKIKLAYTEAEKTINDLQLDIDQLRADITVREGDNKAEQQRRDDMRETITDYRVSLNSVEESLSAMQELSDRIEQERQGHLDRIDKQKQNNLKYAEEIKHLIDKQQEIEERGKAFKHNLQKLDDEAKELMQKRDQLENKQSGYYDQLELATGRLSSIQNEITKTESKASRLELQLDELKNRLWEEYELTINQADDWKKPVENSAEAAKTIADLKNRIKALGPVNITAIESYASLEERFAFMSTQRDDIEAARHKLTSVIADLTEAMREQFVEHFHMINENFRTVFSELFGGGMAELHLEDDQDVLSCGIEIKAQPPGKRLQNLTLLSGGERCLTAIALLFAILKLRPTPFCVLDEVEAALDDANVSRFTDYIRNYAEASQFILVTHRKGTMEAADRLYGVTMQERGISRILSMKLSDEITA